VASENTAKHPFFGNPNKPLKTLAAAAERDVEAVDSLRRVAAAGAARS